MCYSLHYAEGNGWSLPECLGKHQLLCHALAQDLGILCRAAENSIGERCKGQRTAQSIPARHSITARDILARADSSIGFVPPGCMGLSRVGKRGTEFHSPLPQTPNSGNRELPRQHMMSQKCTQAAELTALCVQAQGHRELKDK